MRIYKNPIRNTVKKYVGKGVLRPAHIRKKQKKNKVPRKSNFVRYFNSLQERGPFKPHTLYEKWTKKIRTDMEAAGTWPVDQQVCDVKIVAEYISRLQKEFWNTNKEFVPWETCTYTWLDKLVPGSMWTFRRIYKKIRNKGMRSHLFNMTDFWIQYSVTGMQIFPCGPYTYGQLIFVEPYGLQRPKNLEKCIPYATSLSFSSRW